MNARYFKYATIAMGALLVAHIAGGLMAGPVTRTWHLMTIVFSIVTFVVGGAWFLRAQVEGRRLHDDEREG